MKTITLAYSPDTDDAFMVRAMQERRVDLRGYEFVYTSADIQELNEAASQQEYDVTAISVAAYPSLADDYLLMPVGASVGDDFGPAVIVRPDAPFQTVQELAGKRIAVPGLRTSAFFAARGLIGPFTAVPLHFMKIGPAVASGEVDAGILIHELQIDCERHGFRKLGDLGKLWSRHQDGLPLPLGANAIRKALGAEAIRDINAIYRESIEVGLATREETLRSALRASKADLDLALGDRYISMYVNDRSLRFERDALEAAARLFRIGADAGLCPRVAATGWFVD